jgi:hypothetical protein
MILTLIGGLVVTALLVLGALWALWALDNIRLRNRDGQSSAGDPSE